MVVEHTFVTTMPADAALKSASAFLARGGFVAQTQTAFALDNASWTSIDVHRGKPSSRRVNAIPDLPQQVRVEWDRGRVIVAASIADRHSAKKRTQLLLAIVNGVEGVLVKGQSQDQAYQAWSSIDAELIRSGKWYRLRRLSIRFLILALWFWIFFYLFHR